MNFAVDAPREGQGSESQPLLQTCAAGRCGRGRAGRPGEVSSAKVWGAMKGYCEQGQQVKAEGRRDGQRPGLWWGGVATGRRCIPEPLPHPHSANASAPRVPFPWFRFCSFCKAFLDKCPDGSSSFPPGPPSLAPWEVQIPGLPMMPSFSASLSYIRLGHPTSRPGEPPS